MVVGRQDLGDSDRIVRVLTARGVVDVVARAARASRRRFGGALEVGTRLRAWIQRSRGSLPWLAEVEVEAVPRRARDAYDRLVLLGYGAEVVSALGERGEDDRLLRLLLSWLDRLEDERDLGPSSRVSLEVKALTFAGLAPVLVRCAACGGELDAEMAFSNEAGGAVHVRCGTGARVSAEGLLWMEALRRTPLAEAERGISPVDARWLAADFIEAQIGRALRARALWVDGGG